MYIIAQASLGARGRRVGHVAPARGGRDASEGRYASRRRPRARRWGERGAKEGKRDEISSSLGFRRRARGRVIGDDERDRGANGEETRGTVVAATFEATREELCAQGDAKTAEFEADAGGTRGRRVQASEGGDAAARGAERQTKVE